MVPRTHFEILNFMVEGTIPLHIFFLACAILHKICFMVIVGAPGAEVS